MAIYRVEIGLVSWTGTVSCVLELSPDEVKDLERFFEDNKKHVIISRFFEANLMSLENFKALVEDEIAREKRRARSQDPK